MYEIKIHVDKIKHNIYYFIEPELPGKQKRNSTNER